MSFINAAFFSDYHLLYSPAFKKVLQALFHKESKVKNVKYYYEKKNFKSISVIMSVPMIDIIKKRFYKKVQFLVIG